jgi:hypothetical protein
MKKVLCSLLVALLVAGCADHVTFTEAAAHAPVGFWYGLWHGLILPIAWVVSLFDRDVAIYATYNNGGWYDFGYVWGVACSALGGGAAGARAR